MASERVVAFGRTPTGQAIYDIYFTRMSAAEVVRRHPNVTRDFVLSQRKSPVGIKLYKQVLADRKKKKGRYGD